MKNFGEIKNIFNTILTESLTTKDQDKKELFKKYVKTLKENAVLKTQFNVYTAIEKMVEENEFKATEKIKGYVKLLESFKLSEIEEANKGLINLVKEDVTKLKEAYDKKELHENICDLIFSSNNVDKYVDALHETVNYVKSNIIKEATEADIVPNSILSSIAVDKYNDKYSELDETEKKTIKAIMEASLEESAEIFKKTIKECIELINENLKEADVNLKESLLAAKENLLSREFNSDTFVNDISKILELRNDLK